MIQLASALRLTIFSALVTAVLWPASLALPLGLALPAAVLKIAACGVAIGVVESTTARVRLSRIASYLLVATVLAALALALSFSRGGLA
jgi:formate hydrogenlyase subunit 4